MVYLADVLKTAMLNQFVKNFTENFNDIVDGKLTEAVTEQIAKTYPELTCLFTVEPMKHVNGVQINGILDATKGDGERANIRAIVLKDGEGARLHAISTW